MHINSSYSNIKSYINTDKAASDPEKSSVETKDAKENLSKKQTENNFTSSDLEVIKQLKSRDQEVKNHEMAHVAAGGTYIARGANYQYQKGPDGILYAIGGDVLIDTSSVPGNPEATIRKMDVIKSAALAPANPSSADRAIASQASLIQIKAKDELIKIQFSKLKNEKDLKAYKDQDKFFFKTGLSINVSG